MRKKALDITKAHCVFVFVRRLNRRSFQGTTQNFNFTIVAEIITSRDVPDTDDSFTGIQIMDNLRDVVGDLPSTVVLNPVKTFFYIDLLFLYCRV